MKTYESMKRIKVALKFIVAPYPQPSYRNLVPNVFGEFPPGSGTAHICPAKVPPTLHLKEISKLIQWLGAFLIFLSFSV